MSQTENATEVIVPPKTSPVRASVSRPSDSLFRVVWRWHFYAGLIITPILIVVSLTGAIYIFRVDIEQASRARLMFVTPGDKPVGAQAQVDSASREIARDFPGFKPFNLQVSGQSGRSSVVEFRPGGSFDGLRNRHVRMYVDPYSGRVLGAIDSESDTLTYFFMAVLKIHRQLFVGTTGRVVVELATSWTILLLATGFYLWWPRRREKVRGVWVPRWGAKPYTVLRDLHSVAGAYVFPIALVIVATGLWYSYGLGLNFRRIAGNWEQGKPLFAKLEPRPARARARVRNGSGPGQARKASPDTRTDASTPPDLEKIVSTARRHYPGKVLNVSLVDKTGEGVKVGVSNPLGTPGPFFSTQLLLNPDGTIRSQTNFGRSSRVRWWSSWNYPLHVGSILGLTSKVLWLLACLVLVGLPVTGVWMWWKRRPVGKTGFPRRPAVRLPWWLVGLIALLCTILPMAGASVLLILAGEGVVWLVRSRRTARPRPVGVS